MEQLNWRVILFGANYIPQVGMIEDFSPFWIMDRWTPERMEEDFRIMVALGMSAVRFHISPGNPYQVEYPGLKPGKYLEMLDLAVDFQDKYRIEILLDIGHDFESITEEAVKLYVGRYKGRIKYYQLGNEIYEFLSEKGNFMRIINLIKLGKSIDPQAKFSADVKSKDLYRYREECPEAFAQLDFHPIHFYCPVDYHGWDEVSLDVYSRFCSTDQQVEYPEDYYVIKWGRGRGFGGLNKERWVTEICAQGYFRWGNVTPPEIMQRGWSRVVEASRVDNGPARVFHHCFRDKMSWREFGLGQSGLVYLDGAPKPVAWTFRDEALDLLPDSDVRKWIRLSLEPVSEGQEEAQVAITNLYDQEVACELQLVAGNQEGRERRVRISPQSKFETSLPLDGFSFPPGRSNLFVKLTWQDREVWAYNTVLKHKKLALDRIPPFKGVVYPDGLEPVFEFLNRYGAGLPLITGLFIDQECEMAYRLKCVLDSQLGGNCQVYGSMDCLEATQKPFALVCSAEFNPIGQIIYPSIPPGKKPEVLLKEDVVGFVQIVKQPFGQDRNCWSQLHIGIRHPKRVPEMLYIGARNLEGLKAATYDLIRRMWPNTLGTEVLQVKAKDMLDV